MYTQRISIYAYMCIYYLNLKLALYLKLYSFYFDRKLIDYDSFLVHLRKYINDIVETTDFS